MIEAFERHLKQHNISKQFEEAQTKEDKIEVCKKFLESEGFKVKSNLEMGEEQYREGLRHGMVANPLTLQGGAGGGGRLASAVFDGNQSDSITLDPSVMAGKILTGTINSTVSNPVTYLRANMRISENDMLYKFNDKLNVESYALDVLSDQLRRELVNYIVNKNLLKSEIDHSTLDKHFAVKIGIVG